MSFYQLVRREMQGSLTRLAIASSIGGLSTTLILASINAGAQAADQGTKSLWGAATFVIALILFIQIQQYLLITTTAEIGAIVHKVRVRLMNYVRRSELLPLERIGRAQIVTAITMETTTLTQASTTLAFSVQNGILLILVTLYVAYLSLLAFVICILIIAFGIAISQLKARQLTSKLSEAATWENRLYDRLSDMLDGFKEVRLNRPRSDELFEHIVEVSRAAANLKINTQSETFRRMVFLQSSLYMMLGSVAFVVPAIGGGLGEGTITKAVTALVFIVGSCFGLIQSIPLVAAANAAADRIERLEAQLKKAVGTSYADTIEPRTGFTSIEMKGVEFSYVDRWSSTVFTVGPLDFTLNRGDLVIVTGGNGSGKSTFMKLLVGFYKPDFGAIRVDGVLVTDSTYDVYRSLFTAVFPDYHLFHRLYGIDNPDAAEIDRLLTQFQLVGKTALTDGEFRTVDLSSGQRKRLALIVSLLEKRPILLLDEWAADQDPEFRHKFYMELLPALHSAGITVVAISHDDRYIEEMNVPIRKIRMDEGQFVEQHSVESGL